MLMAVRQFDGRSLHPVWVAAGPAALLIGQFLGAFNSFDDRLIVVCALLASLGFAAAFELSRDGAERLLSRWAAVVLLVATSVGYLTWLPLTMRMLIREASLVFASNWFPTVILVATLCRIALAFVVLAMVKERQELKQRIDALTDPLTGLPNRRALFAAADKLREHSKYLKGDPISVLVFDLDHFKKINDTFGHRFGDRVLQLFAHIISERLETGSIVGRLGGEEFAAILPGADLATAGVTAEEIRTAFAGAAAVLDGALVAGTVSIGAAASDDIDCDLNALFHRADGALYAAKNGGAQPGRAHQPARGNQRCGAVGPLGAALDERADRDRHREEVAHPSPPSDAVARNRRFETLPGLPALLTASAPVFHNSSPNRIAGTGGA